MSATLEDMIAPGKRVKRVRMVGAFVWYVTETGFEFPVHYANSLNLMRTSISETDASVFRKEIAEHLAHTTPEEGSTT
jgi:hypothetical protein